MLPRSCGRRAPTREAYASSMKDVYLVVSWCLLPQLCGSVDVLSEMSNVERCRGLFYQSAMLWMRIHLQPALLLDLNVNHAEDDSVWGRSGGEAARFGGLKEMSCLRSNAQFTHDHVGLLAPTKGELPSFRSRIDRCPQSGCQALSCRDSSTAHR